MAITLKSHREIALMHQAGRILASILAELSTAARPGMTTRELDHLACRWIQEAGAEPVFLGYRGYPACLCTSVNDEVLHGIPGSRRLQAGDLLSLDLGLRFHGLVVDAAVTVIVGDSVHPEAARLITATEEAFWAGCAAAQPGNRVGDIGAAIEHVARRYGYAVIADYGGHGVGLGLHEEPSVPNTGPAGRGPLLRAGMTLAIEPMLTNGSGETVVRPDGWTVVTKDGGLATHYEHTVLVSETGPIVLTMAE